MIPEAYKNIKYALNWYKQIVPNFKEEIERFANFPSLFLGLVNEDDSVEFTDGALRLIDAEGNILEGRDSRGAVRRQLRRSCRALLLS